MLCIEQERPSGAIAATCEFTHQEGAALTSLRMEADTMKNPSREFSYYSAKCSQNGTPLRAIGNEELVCSLHGTSQFSEQVVSRVIKYRQYFHAAAIADGELAS